MGNPVITYLLAGLLIGYLFGSTPFSWILVRMLKGIDMRHYGSRTVSGTMVGVLVSKPAAVLVGILDILKALIPVWLGFRLQPHPFLASAIGIGALIGHCWPFWLGFHGGRGVSTILGSLAVLFPYGALYILFALALGKLLNAGAITVLISLLTMPFLARVLHAPTAVIYFSAAIFVITVIKRLEANREPLPEKGRFITILRRLFFDRDIKDYHAWLSRHP